MPDRTRAYGQSCNLAARIFVPRQGNPIRCVVTHIFSLGAFVRTERHAAIPANFDLAIGVGSSHRMCRLAHRRDNDLVVEFLDPVRREIEGILAEHAFGEALQCEAVSASPGGEPTSTRVRLRRTVKAIMTLMERRDAMMWQYANDS